ncbi:MAG: electron transporter RnfC [Thiotrichales bacterium SG8_50]|nr:MAG: electron transporter RnfC [Thiotrichales bacterium SG8_50]
MGLGHFLRARVFAHGVHTPQNKDVTNRLPVRRLPFASRMILPLDQHIGKPSIPIVNVRQEVVRGEPLARADGFMSVPIHAPATGMIESIELMPTARGPKTMSIVLRVHPGSNQEVLYGMPQDIDSMSPEEIIQAVQDSGLVGLGGAAFPCHVKLCVPEGHNVDTLMVNGCECEPYLTTDHRVMVENTDDLLRGVEIARRAAGAQQAVIGIEDNKQDAYEAIRAKLPKDGHIRVATVPTKYPQGSEKLLISVLLGREVPSGGLPSEVGVLVNNVGTLAKLGELLPAGQTLIERVVTIAGPGVKKPGNYIIPIGTPLRFVMQQVGFTGSAQRVILGGPMMGAAVASLDVPVTKGVTGLLAFSSATSIEESSRKIYHCIKCGKCLEACPLHLNPSQLGLLAAKRQYETMAERYHLFDCFECGCCSYVCPAGIPLVQYFRVAKSVNREKAA